MQQNFRGVYDSSQSYAQYDVISYTFNEIVNYYLCLTANDSVSPQAPLPGNDSSYWGIISTLSNFPNSVDSFLYHPNISPSDQTNISRYQDLILKVRTPSEDDELNNLTQILRDKLVLPDDWNKLQDSIKNLQQFFKTNVEGYINQKQTEFQLEIDKFAYQNDWDYTKQYYKKNFVKYNGQIYIAKADNLNKTPVGDGTDNYWVLLSTKGDKGDVGLNVNFRGSYSNTTTYNLGDGVTYQNAIYYANDTVVGIAPTDANHWTKFQVASISDGINTYTPADIKNIEDEIGILSNLETTDKTNIVNATNSHIADYVKHPGFGITTNIANDYSITLNPAPTSYVNGMGVKIEVNADSTGASTLNVNSLGAKPLKNSTGNDVTNLKTNGIYTFIYNSTTGNFIQQGEGVDAASLITAVNDILAM